MSFFLPFFSFAWRITLLQICLQATVEAIKGQFGFLSHEAEEGRKLFFHTSEVKSGNHLQVGDRVEFVVVYNQRTKKYAACSVIKVGYVALTTLSLCSHYTIFVQAFCACSSVASVQDLELVFTRGMQILYSRFWIKLNQEENSEYQIKY